MKLYVIHSEKMDFFVYIVNYLEQMMDGAYIMHCIQMMKCLGHYFMFRIYIIIKNSMAPKHTTLPLVRGNPVRVKETDVTTSQH